MSRRRHDTKTLSWWAAAATDHGARVVSPDPARARHAARVDGRRRREGGLVPPASLPPTEDPMPAPPYSASSSPPPRRRRCPLSPAARRSVAAADVGAHLVPRWSSARSRRASFESERPGSTPASPSGSTIARARPGGRRRVTAALARDRPPRSARRGSRAAGQRVGARVAAARAPAARPTRSRRRGERARRPPTRPGPPSALLQSTRAADRRGRAAVAPSRGRGLSQTARRRRVSAPLHEPTYARPPPVADVSRRQRGQRPPTPGCDRRFEDHWPLGRRPSS
jgi:hypothetical protein